MKTIALRLIPGQDLRAALEEVLSIHGASAGFVLQGIGSLSVAQLRFGGAGRPTELRGKLELIALGGSLSVDGAHLHAAVADEHGAMFGGHVAPGCIVRTTVEAVVALLPDYRFSRETDAGTGFAELVIRPA